MRTSIVAACGCDPSRVTLNWYVCTVPVKTHILAETTRIAPGAELNLPCEVDGYPLPNVYWTKDGAPLAANQRTQITGVTRTRLYHIHFDTIK